MNFIRYLGISAIAAIMTFLVLTATPRTAHAAGCPSESIPPWTTFTLQYGCSLTGDVYMGQYPNGSQQFDNDSNTGLVVTCGISGGCPGYTVAYGASKTSADANTAANQLRSSGCVNGCWAGVTQVYWTGGYTPPAPTPVPSNRTYFNTGTPVIGGWIYIGGSYVGYSCYVPSAWGSGYVDSGTIYPQFTQGATVTLCTGGTTVPNPAPVVAPPFPWPLPWPYPWVSPTNGATPDACSQWGCKSFNWNDMAVGGVIYLNDGSVFINCYVSNAHAPGTQVGGYELNPSSNYGLPQCDAAHRIR